MVRNLLNLLNYQAEFAQKPTYGKDLYHMGNGDNAGKERNRIALERIEFHLKEALRFWNLLDLSALGSLEQEESDTKRKTCKDALEFCRESLKKLNESLG